MRKTESFFASMKKEALYRKDCKHKTELLSTVLVFIRCLIPMQAALIFARK